MPVFLSAFARLQSWLSPESDRTLSVKASARILRVAGPAIERLITDDRIGETYRCATSHWFRYGVPPLAYYLGSSSTCLIYGPLLRGYKAYRPTGAIIETPGLGARLSPGEAYELDQQIQLAIENTIVDWATDYQERRAAPEPRYSQGKTASPDVLPDDITLMSDQAPPEKQGGPSRARKLNCPGFTGE